MPSPLTTPVISTALTDTWPRTVLTGTPVPGGLSFHRATAVLAACVRHGRTIVGCDLNEVAPREGDGEWNANVGARLLYKMIGYALMSQRG